MGWFREGASFVHHVSGLLLKTRSFVKLHEILEISQPLPFLQVTVHYVAQLPDGRIFNR